jgi:galactoside O-acetyltransferase
MNKLPEVIAVRLYDLVGWVPGRVGVILRRIVARWSAAAVGAGLYPDTGIRVTGWRNISLGRNFRMMRQGQIHAHDGRLRIGDDVAVNSNVCLAPCDGGQMKIGDNVLIGQNAVLRAADHRYDDIESPIRQQGHCGGSIVVDNDVWICANVVVTKNVRIGAHSIVGAGSVVTIDVAKGSIVGGVPAKLIGMRKTSGADK